MRMILLTNFDLILITIIPIILCIVAIGIVFRKLFFNRKGYYWQADTEHDVVHHQIWTSEMSQHSHTHLCSKDPKIHAKYFAPKTKEKE